MAAKSEIADLETRIKGYYERHSVKRVALAALLGGGSTIGFTFLAYLLSVNPFIAITVFAVASFVTVNASIYIFVPRTKALDASRDFILGAIKDPERIQSFDRRRVILSDKKGRPRPLNSNEQAIWDALVVPFFLKHGSRGAARPEAGRRMTNSERVLVEKRRKELIALEKSIKEESAQLERQKGELEKRTSDLQDAENMVIERLSSVERAEAELEQLNEDFARRSKVPFASDSAAAESLAKREAELRDKAAELEGLKSGLAADRKAVALQKRELGELKRQTSAAEEKAGGEDAADAGLNAQKSELDKLRKELEETHADLEDRSRYVEEAENSLIERLHQLSEREARVEQSEINAEEDKRLD